MHQKKSQVFFYNFFELTKENFSDSATILAPQIHQSKQILGNLQSDVWFHLNNILDGDHENTEVDVVSLPSGPWTWEAEIGQLGVWTSLGYILRSKQ